MIKTYRTSSGSFQVDSAGLQPASLQGLPAIIERKERKVPCEPKTAKYDYSLKLRSPKSMIMTAALLLAMKARVSSERTR